MSLLTSLNPKKAKFAYGEPIILDVIVLETSPSQMVKTSKFCKRDTPFDDRLQDVFAILRAPVMPPSALKCGVTGKDPYASGEQESRDASQPPPGWRNRLPQMPFLGMAIEQPPPGPEDTISIPPGEMISTQVDLVDGYGTLPPGRYEVHMRGTDRDDGLDDSEVACFEVLPAPLSDGLAGDHGS